MKKIFKKEIIIANLNLFLDMIILIFYSVIIGAAAQNLFGLDGVSVSVLVCLILFWFPADSVRNITCFDFARKEKEKKKESDNE